MFMLGFGFNRLCPSGKAIACVLFFGALFTLSSKITLPNNRIHPKTIWSNILGDLPKSVWCQRGEIEVEVTIEEIQAGDKIVVQAGEVIAVDGPD